MDGDSLLIMDVLVELEDGSLTNVEIQKVPYAFPAERMSCYSADLVMRQYARVRGERGEYFSYRDMKKVYTIIIFEQSERIFDTRGWRRSTGSLPCFAKDRRRCWGCFRTH